MKNVVILMCILCISNLAFSQKEVDVRLKKVSSPTNACFDIEIKSKNGQEILLAGQNYRLFYNTHILSFDKERVNSTLDKRAYSKLDINDYQLDDIGFLSISIDGRELNDKVVTLNKEGHWKQIMNICFNRQTSEDYELTWANVEKTGHFASAEIALSEWVSKKSQQMITPHELIDYKSSEVIEELNESIEISIYPNPVLDYVNIDLKDIVDADQLIIKDVIGREVVFDQIQGKSILTYDLINWVDGLYTVELLNSKGKRVHVESLLKQGR